jgi:hypothetical protein
MIIIAFYYINNLYLDLGFDCVELGYQINKNNYGIHELSYKFNHMTMYSETWNNNKSRFESYIIHYAGQGNFYGGYIRKNKLDLLKEDYLVLNKYGFI